MGNRIGYLGPPGTFSELAARRYLDYLGKQDRDAEIIPLPSLADVFVAVEGGKTQEGVLPLENSTEGSVNQTLDLLTHRFLQVKIRGEIILPVAHQLLARPGVALKEITRVISHPQALAQCRSFLARFLPEAEIEEAASTAKAAALVAEARAPWAAIGTALVARSWGLAVLAENINDSPDNATRFIVIGLNDAPQMPGCKTSLLFSVQNRPGALCDVLWEFSKKAINLTRIESRPAKNRLGEYLFFVDFEGHRREQAVQQTLAAIKRHVVSMRVLGSYPSYPVNGRFSSLPAPPAPVLLKQLRAEIDHLDEQIIMLLAQRARLVRQVGELKRRVRLSKRDKGREEEIIRRLRALAGEQGLDGQIVEKVYRLLFAYYVSLQVVS